MMKHSTPQAQFYPKNMVVNKKLVLRPESYKKSQNTLHSWSVIEMVSWTTNVDILFPYMNSGSIQLTESTGKGLLGIKERVLIE